MNTAFFIALGTVLLLVGVAVGFWLGRRKNNSEIVRLTGQLDSSAARLGDAVKTSQQQEKKEHGK